MQKRNENPVQKKKDNYASLDDRGRKVQFLKKGK